MSKMAELQNAEVRIREVAERISHLREDLGISVEEMAVNTGYSVEDYKKYESGEQDFSCVTHGEYLLSVPDTPLRTTKNSNRANVTSALRSSTNARTPSMLT